MSVMHVAARMRGSFIALALVAAPAFASAQTPAAAAPAAGLPDAKSIIADYVKAIGGKEAADKVQSVHMSGTFEMPAMGMTGTVDASSARPNKQVMVVNIAGVGDITSGSNGTVVWAMNPMAGPTIVSGADLAAALEDADFGDTFKDATSFVTAETIEKTTMDGKACYKVKVTKKSGTVEFDCYAVDTHLLVGSTKTPVAAQGEQASQFIREYKAFGGVMFPVKMAVSVAGQEQVVTWTNVEINTVAPTKFDLPAEIKALIK